MMEWIRNFPDSENDLFSDSQHIIWNNADNKERTEMIFLWKY